MVSFDGKEAEKGNDKDEDGGGTWLAKVPAIPGDSPSR